MSIDRPKGQLSPLAMMTRAAAMGVMLYATPAAAGPQEDLNRAIERKDVAALVAACKAGADIHAPNKRWKHEPTPMHDIGGYGTAELARAAVKECHGDTRRMSKSQCTPVDMARVSGNKEVLKYFDSVGSISPNKKECGSYYLVTTASILD